MRSKPTTKTFTIGNKPFFVTWFLRNLSNWLVFGVPIEALPFGPFGLSATTSFETRFNDTNPRLNNSVQMDASCVPSWLGLGFSHMLRGTRSFNDTRLYMPWLAKYGCFALFSFLSFFFFFLFFGWKEHA